MNKGKWRQRWKFLFQQGLFNFYKEQEITKISCHQHLQNPHPKTFFAYKFNIVKKISVSCRLFPGQPKQKQYLLSVFAQSPNLFTPKSFFSFACLHIKLRSNINNAQFGITFSSD